jgi:hypothetical protein
MGLQKCRSVGKSQSALVMINPIIFTRTRADGWGCTPRQRRARAAAEQQVEWVQCEAPGCGKWM